MFNPSTTTVDADEIAAAKPLMEMPVTSAIYSPRAGAVLEPDETASVGGFAWSGGGRGIIRVDVSADGGSTWHKTELTAGADQPSGRAWAWTFWEAEVRYLGGTSRRYLSAIYLGELRSPRRRAQHVRLFLRRYRYRSRAKARRGGRRCLCARQSTRRITRSPSGPSRFGTFEAWRITRGTACPSTWRSPPMRMSEPPDLVPHGPGLSRAWNGRGAQGRLVPLFVAASIVITIVYTTA